MIPRMTAEGSWAEEAATSEDDDRLGTSGGCDSAVRTVDARAAVSDPGERESGGVRNMSTSGLSILVHAVIYFALVTIFVIAVSVHIYSGSG
ncbi:hypothetical protein CK203_030718 [Vitis vinifera]|uniref:Uncharacterized protein n=1 Tax=Vitis vinifera TaxID=29760 RepID=A0A438IRJ7_VITVI|nr:hypothetical protein CK203_030718 [Vitis vinifera]